MVAVTVGIIGRVALTVGIMGFLKVGAISPENENSVFGEISDNAWENDPPPGRIPAWVNSV
jgi:hypothetical protein